MFSLLDQIRNGDWTRGPKSSRFEIMIIATTATTTPATIVIFAPCDKLFLFAGCICGRGAGATLPAFASATSLSKALRNFSFLTSSVLRDANYSRWRASAHPLTYWLKLAYRKTQSSLLRSALMR